MRLRWAKQDWEKIILWEKTTTFQELLEWNSSHKRELMNTVYLGFCSTEFKKVFNILTYYFSTQGVEVFFEDVAPSAFFSLVELKPDVCPFRNASIVYLYWYCWPKSLAHENYGIKTLNGKVILSVFEATTGDTRWKNVSRQ